ncbi:MAG: DUF1351 domain-containing protein [Clostridiales Family XIII bacterium]|jgi:hypothetical protein|nr:DUF1351 domain-containing protein [Clostridiales Family XIII bacterium]
MATKKELIVVKQLPIIEERLKTIKEQIQTRTKEALALECTEETVKEIKKIRAELSSGFKELEAQRKEVKKTVMAPYDQFEAVYRACVTDVYAPADAELKSRIDEVENVVREEKRAEIAAYFDEYAKSKNIDFLTFDKMGLQVGLSTNAKSMKSMVAEFVDGIADGLTLIDTQEYKEEILVEYKKSLNAVSAITSVKQRHEAIEAERKRAEAAAAKRAAEVEAATESEIPESENEMPESEIPEPFRADDTDDDDDTGIDVEPAAETIVAEYGPVAPGTTQRADLTVYGTVTQLKTLEEFLVNKGYMYELR